MPEAIGQYGKELRVCDEKKAQRKMASKQYEEIVDRTDGMGGDFVRFMGGYTFEVE